ncbi:MAG TPA: anti-phage dCTP deaminase [Thermoanaerobaculia bacterium]|nr:anti-phage dCTP deaminase [Thermoanaerobaculia bacterium]
MGDYHSRVSEGPELVIGFVGAIGTDLASVSDSLQRHLSSVGYSSSEIRVSALLHDIERYAHLAEIQDQEAYYDEHMSAGNALCERLERSDAMALLAVLQLRTFREERNSANGQESAAPFRRHAFIINSLKRKDEITALRRVYGDGFILLGAYAARDRRLETLATRIARSQNKEAHECRHIAERLIARDEAERADFGQDVSHTFFRADAFVDATERPLADDAIRRFVEVVFGHPFATPTREELGMQHAFSAALRSADLSRQVGAAITTDDGQILAVGTNDVPKAGGGMYWPGPYDYRDFRFAETDEPNAEMKRVILADLLVRLRDEKFLAEDVKLDDAKIAEIGRKLKDSRLMSITEYGRMVHAEMAAITDAARRGVSVAGARLFCTTFPCHNCAKHIVAAGLHEVIYIEPYPKSQVALLFSDSIALDRRPTENQMVFSSFVGFAPTRFADLFQMSKRVDDQKHILKWEEIRTTALPRISGIPTAYLTEEESAIETLSERMVAKSISFKKGGDT